MCISIDGNERNPMVKIPYKKGRKVKIGYTEDFDFTERMFVVY